MEFNNKFLAVVLVVLGIFLTIVSLRISSVVEGSSNCTQKASLLNSNRIILMLGVFMFASSVAYLMCKMNCSGEVQGSVSDMVYLVFNLVLGIVVLVLFSIIRSGVDSCLPPNFTGFDSMLVNIGIAIGAISVLTSLFVLSQKFHSNKDEIRQRIGRRIAGMSPPRDEVSPVVWKDPFGFPDVKNVDPEL
jgi:hypothetical protein